MNYNTDTRWVKRLISFQKTIDLLDRFMEKFKELNDMERQGLIQSFEYCFELSWNVIKDYYTFQGVSGIQGSRDSYQTALNRGLIQNGQVWMDMIESRILSVHSYDEETANKIINDITTRYNDELKKLLETMNTLAWK